MGGGASPGLEDFKQRDEMMMAVHPLPDGDDSSGLVRPSGAWRDPEGLFLTAARSPWSRLVLDLQDAVTHATFDFWRSRGLKAAHLPITTRTVTCPTGLGSDSVPVSTNIAGVDTFLSDSMQFLLEYGCRIAEGGCYNILPSFRGDLPDKTHLNQFTHSEAEFPGDLDHLIATVEAYLRHIVGEMVEFCGPSLARAVGNLSHLEAVLSREGSFERMTFSEAARLLGNDPQYIRDDGQSRTMTRRGERQLMSSVGEFVWVTHFDHLSVPFYQAFEDNAETVARNADLFFGIGEVVGAGERHATGEEVRAGLKMHEVEPAEYAWYARMKDEMPMKTSGFGLGVDRLLLWALRHDDIRDIPLVPRVVPPPVPSCVDAP